MSQPPAVTVVIVNYNAGARLARCLDALGAQTFRDFETIVVDNASTDGSQDAAMRAGVSLIRAETNIGFAAANNRAAAAAHGRWLALLNPDAYPYPDWLAQLMEATERHPGVDAFGSTQLDAADPSRIDGAGDALHVLGVAYRGHFGWPAEKMPPESECFAPCAAAALYRRETFMRLRGFDEAFFCYGEDVDFGFRLRLCGGACVQVAAAVVLHEGSGVSGRRSDFTVYHGHRNRLWLIYKNMPGAFYWPLLPFQFLMNALLMGRAVLIGAGAPYWRAMRDGYGKIPQLRAERRRVQAGRTVSLSSLARAFAWSPIKLLRREASPRPVKSSVRFPTPPPAKAP